MKRREIAILALIGLVIGLIAKSNWKEASLRRKVSETKARQQNLKVALEAYHLDHQSYPAPDPLTAWSSIQGDGTRKTNPFWSELEKMGGEGMHAVASSLTTPIAYISSMPLDPFSIEKNNNQLPFGYFVYWSSDTLKCDQGWMLTSPGPDRDYDIVAADNLYRPDDKFISIELERLTFNLDSLRSGSPNGDIWELNLSKSEFEKHAPWRWD